MSVHVLLTYVSKFHVHTVCLRWPDAGIRSNGTGFTDRCEPQCGCWESTVGPLEKKSVP